MNKSTNTPNTIQFDVSNPKNTWVFSAGKIANGTNISGYRTYIGHFEEIIRSENIGDDIRRYALQRYVINVSNEGDTVERILAKDDNIIKPLGPKMVAIMVGIEDCQAGTQMNTFQTNLTQLIGKIRKDGRVPVIMTPNAVLDTKIKERLADYIQVVRTVTASEKVDLVDFYKIWSNKGNDYIASRLSDDAVLPNEMGHLDMGKQLANSVGSRVSDTAAMNKIVTKFNDSKIVRQKSLDGLIPFGSGDPITWMFIGDSITHGAIWTYGYDDFTQLFEKRVRNEMGRTGDIVINTGVSGATTTEFMDNIECRFGRYHCDVAFIMFGMNDCVRISIEEFETNLEAIVNKVRGKNAIPILKTPNIAPGRMDKLPPYMESIRKVAKKKGVMLIDHFKEWEDRGATIPVWEQWVNVADSNMKIHPSSLGHLNMAKSIFKAIGIYDPQSEICTIAYSSIDIPNNLHD